METWSSGGNSFNSGSMSYDFTNSASKAYGNNQLLKGTRYCIYNGDVNQDNIVNLNDLVLVHNDVTSFVTGFINTDLTGDMSVNISDVLIAYNNSVNFVRLMRP